MFADFNLEVTRPWLLIGLAIVLPWLVLYFFRSLVDFARWQRIASLVMRFAIAILLALALAGLTMLTPTDRQYIVVAIDESLSVGENAQKKIDEFTKGLKESVTPDSKISYITFSKNVGQPQSDPPVYFSVEDPDAGNNSQSDDQENAGPNKDSANIEAAPVAGTPVPVPSNEYDKTKLGSNLEEAIEVAEKYNLKC